MDVVWVSCKCPEATTFNYINDKVVALNLDNSGIKPELSGTDSVRSSAFGLRINIERILIAALKREEWNFGSKAYANKLYCSTGEYYPKAAIETINIISLHAFNSSLPAGADVTDCFKRFKNGDFSEIADLYELKRQVLYADALEPIEADFLLTKVPDYLGEHQFVVTVHLVDGAILNDTATVKLY